jgi:hypothetical protein
MYRRLGRRQQRGRSSWSGRLGGARGWTIRGVLRGEVTDA